MIKIEEIISVGKFQKTHALKGELNLILDIDPEYFQEGNPMIVDYEGIWVPYFVDSIRSKGSISYLVKLNGINSEKEASLFVNKDVYILKKDADDWLEIDNDDVFSLIGYTIIDATSNLILGKIRDIDDSTPNLLFILETNDEEDTYIPASDDFITEINGNEKTIKMNLPEGLMEINNKV